MKGCASTLNNNHYMKRGFRTIAMGKAKMGKVRSVGCEGWYEGV